MLRSGGAGTVTTMAQEPDLPPPDAGFEVVRRGYDQGQVDDHLRRLDAEIQILATDRDAALDQSAQLARELDDARARAERLRVQVRSLVSPPQSVQGMSERMRSMLRLAEDEAGEMLGRAEQEVAGRRREAEVHAAEVLAAAREEAAALLAECRAEAERSSQEIGRVRAELEADIAAAREQLTADRTAATNQIAADHDRATRERETAWTKSESRRKMIEEDFTIAMDRRRAEALAQLAAEQKRLQLHVEATRARSAKEAHSQLEQARLTARQELERAHASAQTITAEARRQLRELLELRGRILEQLGGTRTALDESLAALAPLPEELPRAAANSSPAGSVSADTVAMAPVDTVSATPRASEVPPGVEPTRSPSSETQRPEPARPPSRDRAKVPHPARVAAGRPAIDHG
jgi:cell division septum initiation protein DivIVA